MNVHCPPDYRVRSLRAHDIQQNVNEFIASGPKNRGIINQSKIRLLVVAFLTILKMGRSEIGKNVPLDYQVAMLCFGLMPVTSSSNTSIFL